MAREQRVHFIGATYHVMMRGNNKQKIFFEDQHCQRFLMILRESIERFLCKIHAYCLMPNHVHLIVEVGEICLSTIMHNISLRYVHWFNRHHQRIGHLFQGRYKALLIQDDEYFLELCRYIHLNPVRAKLVNIAENYKWSSHSAYLGREKISWLTREHILRILQKQFVMQRVPYADFIQENVDYKFVPLMYLDEEGQVVIADKSIFSDDAAASLVNVQRKIPLETIIDVVCCELDVNKENLSCKNKCSKLTEARAIIALCVEKYSETTMKELANVFQRSYSTICNSVVILRKQAHSLDLGINLKLESIKMQLNAKMEKDSCELGGSASRSSID
jgi:putative transposase